MHDTLVVVAKRPAAGSTKTRLCPPLTGEQAAQLYECFLLDTLEIMRRVPDVERIIAYLPEGMPAGMPVGTEDYFNALAPDMRLTPQRGDTLGERLDNLLVDELLTGAARVVVVNSDGPTLSPDYLRCAFSELTYADLVLGPSEDGGYYLVGTKNPRLRLFHQVQMSTPQVFADTLALAERYGLSVSLTPAWYDVDTIQDLRRLGQELSSLSNGVAPHTRRWLRAFARQVDLNGNDVSKPKHEED